MDDEVRQIRAQLLEEQSRRKEAERRREEEQRRREEAEHRREEEQHKREEEQRRREEAEHRREEEQHKREEEQRRREEEQRRREEAEHRRDEEQRRREEAERAAASAVDQDLAAFLHGCHKLSTRIRAVTELSAATSGSTTNPTNRLFPQHILLWPDFATRQHEFWALLAESDSIWTERSYPSAANLDFLEREIDPVSSEDDLRYLERMTVENMVRRVLQQVSANDEVDESLRSYGTISFENQASFRAAEVSSLGPTMTRLSLEEDRTELRRNTRADQFCVVRSRDGIARPVVAIEYKAPHKLTVEAICIGLRTQICPERDVIDKYEDNTEFLYKNLIAAVITQLFSYMIDKGVRYGYICTGEAFVFMRILDDPTTVYYSINIPNRDYADEGVNCLERTAVSQVAAFIRQALQDEPPDQTWLLAARRQLRRWKIEFIDVLKTIPETVRQTRDASVYQPSRWISSIRKSPILLRSGCRLLEATPERQGDDSDTDDGERDMPSPTPRYPTRSRAAAAHQTQTDGGGKQPSRQDGQGSTLSSAATIEKRPYCTHQCLRGLSTGLPLDPLCPNVAAHGPHHPPRAVFLQQLRKQLAVDRGPGADCCALYIHGARGALLKLCLTTHGYTLVAKGVPAMTLRHLQNEARIYDQLNPIQGRYVPVSCGLIDLVLPFYYDGIEIKHILLMSWAGKSFVALAREPSAVHLSKRYLDLSAAALQAIHSLHVLHCDAMPRNIMYDEAAGTVMIVDFERSEQNSAGTRHQILGEMSPNRGRRLVCSASRTKDPSPDCFRKELRSLSHQMQKALT